MEGPNAAITCRRLCLVIETRVYSSCFIGELAVIEAVDDLAVSGAKGRAVTISFVFADMPFGILEGDRCSPSRRHLQSGRKHGRKWGEGRWT